MSPTATFNYFINAFLYGVAIDRYTIDTNIIADIYRRLETDDIHSKFELKSNCTGSSPVARSEVGVTDVATA